MDIRQLQYFLKIVECGSLTTAAAQLGIAQPTLTKSIRSLERQLGVELFRRLPRGVEPTAAGLRLAEHGRLADLQLRDALRAIGSLETEPTGVVTIGAGPAWLRRLLPEAVSLAIGKHSALNVRVVGGFDDALLKDLRAGALDFVVAEIPEARTAADLSATRLVQDDLGIAARAGHPLAKRACRLADLLDYPWVMPPLSTRARRRLDALFVAAGLPAPEVRIETASMAFLLEALRGGDLLTLTVSTTLLAAGGGGLAWLDVAEVKATREAGILMRRGGWLSPAMRAVIDELTAICALNPRN
jgi:DNA-binding transcriptional LysR family regulator